MLVYYNLPFAYGMYLIRNSYTNVFQDVFALFLLINCVSMLVVCSSSKPSIINEHFSITLDRKEIYIDFLVCILEVQSLATKVLFKSTFKIFHIFKLF